MSDSTLSTKLLNKIEMDLNVLTLLHYYNTLSKLITELLTDLTNKMTVFRANFANEHVALTLTQLLVNTEIFDNVAAGNFVYRFFKKLRSYE